ncbi:4-pyridoxate dehydrogenase [Pseudolycoriella hygida]|uniref:4-pyridoxate dehydrogenase n=1 Tax=Pseudolycoriella hygida TaxID=35572 RepID=A0A9Q0RWM2_9DIPT|nr:4-pyridoxate dehydrogenase [Pseudolycoriella hygida]
MNIADFLLGPIPILIQFYANLDREADYKNTLNELKNEHNVPKVKVYDFVVVGGGSAGCVIAGRLSTRFNVLLLEAGGDPPPATNVPFYVGDVGQAPTINYSFESVPQTNASLYYNGISKSKTGKMLGGSGSHNDMIHSRGSPHDYDNWASLLKDDSFKYSNVLKYFKRMETFIGPKYGVEGDEYYGNDGPIMVSASSSPVLDLWLEAGVELGYEIGDPNGFQHESFAPLNVAMRKGKRSSSYIEYIKHFEGKRKTLTVIRYANVSEILLDENKKAYGVAYSRHGIPQIAHASKEIILSAGTYSSPMLLMKSGIGPVSTLNAAEIPVKVPLEAVGKNLIEHTLFVLSGLSVNDSSIFLDLNSSEIETVTQQFHSGDGILTVNTEAQCFFTSSKSSKKGWPDVWIAIHPRTGSDGTKNLNFYPIIARPKSRGILSMDSLKYKAGVRDDQQLALIDYKFLTHPDDIEALLDGIKLIFKIIDTKAFQSVNMTYISKPDPVCKAHAFLSDDYWRCQFTQYTMPCVHMVGTCGMGPDSGDSSTSVVDTKFRVRGVSNLRVVDASVMPEITNANINAAVLMLAEKASDDIIGFYSRISNSETNPSELQGMKNYLNLLD